MSLKAATVKAIAAWVLRVFLGATFVLSGWAKCVDPWGFVYKIQDYLTVWGIESYFTTEVCAVSAVALSVTELVLGIALLTGSMRRAAPLGALGMMAFMLPLTVYIYIADPVADCGCFGDLWVISNGATLAKNIAITLGAFALLWLRKAGDYLIRPTLQWVALDLTGLFGLALALVGWSIQPVADFRPYAPGQPLMAESASESVPQFIYEKDGELRAFALDALPDSTWTFVSAGSSAGDDDSSLAVFDGDDEVTDEVLGADGDLMILVVNNPSLSYLTRARLCNEISHAVDASGGRMIGLIAADGESFDLWADIARPDFPVFSCGDTALKQLARGAAALVAVRDGKVMWKRSLATVDPDIATAESPLDSVTPVDDGLLALRMSTAWLFLLLILIVFDHFSRSHPQKS